MAFNFPRINLAFFTRFLNGDTFYAVDQFGSWSSFGGSNLQIAQNHPILTSAMLFLAKLFSQAEFYIENEKTKERITEHWLLDLLNKPNYYQTRNDFLESSNFIQIAEGRAVIWLRKTTGMPQPESIYILNGDLIEYPDEFTTPLSVRNKDNKIQSKKILYDRDGQNEKIPIKDLIFLYDLPNGMDTTNMFEVKSRLDGLKQTLLNTKDSLTAKNIILKTNGKELLTLDKGAGTFPLGTEEKKDAEDLLHNTKGLGKGRVRGIVTKAPLKWQSLHIALRDLGLDESVKVDGNLIYTALHIPKDILSLEAKKTTYNNFKESMVSFIQNEMQPTVNAFLEPFQKLITEKGLKLRGTYENMPIMQFMLLEKYEGILKRALALSGLRNAGLPDDIALELCGFDKTTKLNPLIVTEPGNGKEEKANMKQLEELIKELIDVELEQKDLLQLN